MANLKEIWIERYFDLDVAIRLDWENDMHHRIEIKGTAPQDVMEALILAALRIESSLHKDRI